MLSNFIILALLLIFVLCDDSIPKPLTEKTFKSSLESGLHLVEFFSPYCSHCKSFAPTWEKTWRNFHEEGEKLGIRLAQVDCVESGDLCNQEKINAYPFLKLYGPNGFIKNYPKNYRRTEEDLVKFCKAQSLELADTNFNIESASELITTDRLVGILAEPQPNPYFISFWPSSDLQDLNEIDITKFTGPFEEEAIDIQRTWNVASSRLKASNIKTGHFNCLSNQKICERLDLNIKIPQILLILPHLASGKVIKFDQSIYKTDAKELVKFAERTLKNFNPPSTNITGLYDIGLLAHTAGFDSIPEEPATHFIYLYDEASSPEDFDILPHLIEPLSLLPDTYLHISNDSNLLNWVQLQHLNLHRSLRLDPAEQKGDFNEQRSVMERLTSLPTLICFKEHSMISSVYHSFGPSDIRDPNRLVDWVKRHAQPAFSKFEAKTIKKYLSRDENHANIAIQLLNSTEEKLSLEAFNNFIFGYQDYTNVRGENHFQQIKKSRADKSYVVEQLKASTHAASKDIVQALSKEIKYPIGGDVDLFYLDISEDLQILRDYGLNIDSKRYSTGDVLILDNSLKYYFDTNENGQALSTSSSSIAFRNSLSIIEGFREGKIKKNLRNSPYGPSLRYLDYIHRFGILGYLITLIFLFFLVRKRPFLIKRKKDNKGLSILDDPSKFD